MKRFSEFQKKSIRINEQEISLPDNTETTTKTIQPEPSQSEDSGSSPIKFFSKLFEARQMAHIFHLQVKSEMGSGWEHDALNKFYDDLLEFLDDLVETYQGQYGILEGYETIDTSATSQTKSLDYLKQTVDFIKKERSIINQEDTHLHNVIDEVVGLFYKTIYKLTYLK
jgi:hypothetical protein